MRVGGGELRKETRRQVRTKILALLSERPGASITEMLQHAGVEWGTVQHHLRILRDAGLVRSVHEGRTHRFFRTPINTKEAQRVALLRRARVLNLVDVIVHAPGIRQKDLGAGLGMSRKVLRQYADRLATLGLVREERQGRERHYHATPDARRILETVRA